MGGERNVQALLAAERTLLAWLRTGISLLAFGFVVARFDLVLHARPSRAGSLLGALLAGLGGLFALLAAVRYWREVRSSAGPEPAPALGLIAGAAVALAGVVVTSYLLVHRLP